MNQHDPYTPIHNDVLEALCRVNLSPYETRVLMATWRKTFGFLDKKTGMQKKNDRISLSQYEELTGIDSRLVSRAIAGLKKKGIIERDGLKPTGLSKAFMKKMGSQAMVPTISHTSLKTIRGLSTVEGLEPIGKILQRREKSQ